MNYDFFGNLKNVYATGGEYSGDMLKGIGYPVVPWSFENPALPDAVSTPEEGVTSLKYDRLGNVIKSVDAEGIVKENDYDKYARISKTTAYKVSDSDTKEEVYFYYGGDAACVTNINAVNRVCKVTGKSIKDGVQAFFVSDSFEYDAVGRIKKRTQNINDEKNYILLFGYDFAGNLRTLTYPDGKLVQYNYNSMNQLESVSYTNPQGQVTEVSYDYNPTGTIDEKSLTSAGVVKFYTTYSYNQRDFLTSIFASKQKNTDNPSDPNDVYFKRTYAYDPAGNLDKINYDINLANRGNMPTLTNYESFTYDNLNRLTGANYYTGQAITRGITYGYDALGNRKTETSTINPVYTKGYTYENNKLKGISGEV